MPEDAETLFWGLKAFNVVFTLVEIAKLFCMLGLMTRMRQCGDKGWSWATLVVALCGVAYNWVGNFVPGLRLTLGVVALLGTVGVLVVGWIKHREYAATTRMIVLTGLFLTELLLIGLLAGAFFLLSSSAASKTV